MTGRSTLKSLLDAGQFVVTAEIAPKLSASPDALLEQAAPLRGKAAAVNVTDAAGARVSVSSLAAAALLARDGIEPVMQMTCRDRNRIAIAGDLIGAAALGIRNVLVLTGDDPRAGDEPDAKPVFDLTSTEVVTAARGLSDDGVTPSGRALASRPDFFVGVADAPFDPPADWKPDKLQEKIDAGAGFVQTQFCFEPAIAERYFERLGDSGLTERASFLLGIGPFASARSAKWMDENLYGVSVPDHLIRRLEDAPDPAAEGRRICIELIDAYRDMPGVAGVHLMAPGLDSQCLADIIDAAGLGGPRTAHP